MKPKRFRWVDIVRSIRPRGYQEIREDETEAFELEEAGIFSSSKARTKRHLKSGYGRKKTLKRWYDQCLFWDM